MKRIDLYLGREFIKTYLMAVAAVMVIGLAGAMVDDLADYLRDGYTLAATLRAFLWMVPAIFVQFSPLAVMITVLVVLGTMSRKQEIMILEGAGLHPFRFLVPFLVLGLPLSLAGLAVNEGLVPKSLGQVRSQPVLTRPTLALPNLFMYADNYQVRERTFTQINLLRFGPAGTLEELVKARRARVGKSGWDFETGTRLTFAPDGGVAGETPFQTQRLDLDLNVQQLDSLLRPVEVLSLRQLSDYLRRLAPADLAPATIRTAYYGRFSYPALNLVLVLLALPLLLGRHLNRSFLILIGIILSILTYWLYSFCLALGKQASLPPLLAAFLPHLVIIAAAFLYAWLSAFSRDRFRRRAAVCPVQPDSGKI
ncbi:MAG TPA: LptF/LptG family permease [bacterium]|nr:LptF/LptG family permease [bacterium]